MTRLMLM